MIEGTPGRLLIHMGEGWIQYQRWRAKYKCLVCLDRATEWYGCPECDPLSNPPLEAPKP
jgi:hypothetical protein